MTETQEQLIREIEQQLDNLSCFNEMLFDYWCTELYTDDDEPITEKFTSEVLQQITKDVEENDND